MPRSAASICSGVPHQPHLLHIIVSSILRGSASETEEKPLHAQTGYSWSVQGEIAGLKVAARPSNDAAPRPGLSSHSAASARR
jgi:hypothetical protein